MLDIIIKAVFFIIGKIGDIILIPIMAVIRALLPNLTIDFNAIFDFLEMAFEYIPFFLKCLLIPSYLIQLLVIVFTASYSIILGLRAYKFIMKIYTKFKP